ncbi:MAG TPA: hypothetical protein DCL61_22240, partial [Cyanobacteria bacterium UBA12227]|nr:hypothetical protein [Cyanobacteria bacterium UBA12227]
SETVEETVESEELSGEEASQSQESPNTGGEGEDVPQTAQSEVGSGNQQPQMPSLQAQLEKVSRFGYNGLDVPVDAPGIVSSPVQRKLTLDGVENEYQPEVIERADPVLNGLNQFKVQRQSESGGASELNITVMRHSSGGTGGGTDVTNDVEQGIQQAKGGGQGLDESVRQPMEQALGTDFSGVRVHTDAQSDQLNRSIQAKAFTTGQDIFFKQGEFDPGSRGGQELLAHELTHVVQQTGGLRLSKEIRRQIQPEDEEKQPLQAKKIAGQTPHIFRSKDIHLQPQLEQEEKQPLQAKELSAQTPIISRSKELLSSPQEQEEETETINAKEFSNQIPAISPAQEMLSAPDAEPEHTDPLEAKEFSNQTLEVSQQKELGWQSEQNQEKSEPLQAKQLPELVFDSNLIQKKRLDGGDFTPSPPAIQRGLLSGIKDLADKGLEWITSKIIQPMKDMGASGWNAVKNFGSQISTAFQQANPQIWDVFQPQYLMFRMARNQRQQLFAQAIQQERQQKANAAKSQAGSAPNVNEPSQLERLDALATTVESGADAYFGVGKELVEGAVLGDFKENPSIWNTIGQIAIGFVPYAGQVADVRDLIASVKKLHESGYKDPWEWFNLVLVGVGFIPGIGDAIKAAGRGAKGLIRNSLKGVLKNADNLLRPVLKRAKGMLDGAKHYGKKFAQWASKLGPSLVKGVKQFGQKTLDFAKGAAQKARGLLTTVKSKVSGFVSSAVQKARDVIGQGKGLLGQAVGKFIGKAKEVFGGLKNRVSQAADSVKGLLQRGKQLATKVGQKVADVTGKAKKLLQEFTQGAIQKGKEVVTRTKTFVQEQITKATEVGRKLVTQARQRVENLVRQGVKLAKDKVVPFIKEKIAGVKHRIKSFLEDKWNKLKEKLGIKDPEKPGKKPGESGANNADNAAKKAQELPAAIAMAKGVTETNDALDTPVPALIGILTSTVKSKYSWIDRFEARPKAVPGHYSIHMIASDHEIDKDYTEGEDSKFGPDGKFQDPELENRYQKYLERKKKRGQPPRDRSAWKEESDYWTKDSPMARGNAFNESVRERELYPYDEVHLENGKRLDSYDPEKGEIVSRKATDFDDIEKETFQEYLRELKTKYPPGTKIRSNKYSQIDGQELKGRMILEVPASNVNAANKEIFEGIAKSEGIEIRYTPE